MKSLSHWNYRVVKRTETSPDGSIEEMYGIHECYYKPTGWTEEPVPVIAESKEGLRDVLNKMLIALEVEVIDASASALQEKK